MIERVWGVWEREQKLKNIYLHHDNAGLPIIYQLCIFSFYWSHLDIAYYLVAVGDILRVHLKPFGNIEEALPQPNYLP